MFAEGCDTAFVEDLAVLIMMALSHQVLAAAATDATGVRDSPLKCATPINYKPGKTEALIVQNAPKLMYLTCRCGTGRRLQLRFARPSLAIPASAPIGGTAAT